MTMAGDPRRFDAIVIGAGPGGLTVAAGLAGLGRMVALVEQGRVGGDCTNTGCIPSKRLIHLARTGGPEGNGNAMADVRATRDGLAAREREEFRTHPLIDLVEGHATLVGRDLVRVRTGADEALLTAPHVVIATGSDPVVLPVPGLPPEQTLTSDSLFDVGQLPRGLAIIGGGPMGVEIGEALADLGTQITIIEVASRLLPAAAPESSEVLLRTLTSRGVSVLTRTRAVSYDASSSTLRVTGPDGEHDVRGIDAVLMAAGRRPRTAAMGLAKVGVATTPDGHIPVDSWGRTRVRGVWATGDVVPGSHQTSAAGALGRRIVQRLAFPWLPPVGRVRAVPQAVFTTPEVAWVGRVGHDLDAACHPSAVTRVRVDFTDTDRGLTDGLTEGFVMIDAVRLTGRIVGATVVGPGASDLITTLALAIDRRASLFAMSRLTYPYPALAGAIGMAADEFARRTMGNLRREATGYARFRLARAAGRGRR
jgi:dihydrolipoamide dehydrogenase